LQTSYPKLKKNAHQGLFKNGETAMIKFQEIQYLTLAEIWKTEREFRDWLAKNISKLTEVLGLELEVQEREAPVGAYNLDLLCENLNSKRNVVIEIEYGSTDHDHLGKLMTYAGGYEAEHVVLIAEIWRDEHSQALEYLNDQCEGAYFWGIKPEILKIGDSEPGFRLLSVVKPYEKPEPPPVSEKGKLYQSYFQDLFDTLRKKGFTSAQKAPAQSWCTFGGGVSGMWYGCSFGLNNKVRAEIGWSMKEKEFNKQIFDEFFKYKDEIEKQIGQPLTWERLDDKIMSRITIYREGSVEVNPQTRADILQWHVGQMLKFKEVFTPYIKKVTKKLK
jgi:hypothetical protein